MNNRMPVEQLLAWSGFIMSLLFILAITLSPVR